MRDNMGRFVKGNIPLNKGKRMSQEQYERRSATMFKKGNIPPNRQLLGSERLTKNGYIEVKVSNRIKAYELKHRIVWEQHRGDIPKGYNIQFKDGNRQNCDIRNLYIISKSEQLRTQNGMHANYPKEITLAMQAKGALTRQINRFKKGGIK